MFGVSFKGRLNRKPYLGYMLLVWLVAPTMILMVSMPFAPRSFVGEIIFPLVFLYVCLASVGLTTRRLHDLGHSGWLQLVSFIPLVNLLFSAYLFLGVGQKGANRFGEDPLNLDNNGFTSSELPSKESQANDDNFLAGDPSEALQRFKASKK